MPSWWIDEPRLLGTSNPTTEQVRGWYVLGFRAVISFLQEAIQRPYYDVDMIQAMGYARYNIPIEDFTAPAQEQYQTFLKIVDAELKRGSVVIHCFAGQGRTGAMAAAYWIGKGLTAEQAIEKIRYANPFVLESRFTRASLIQFEQSRRAQG